MEVIVSDDSKPMVCQHHVGDYFTVTDAIIACPDPNCGGRFLITREGKRTYRHSEKTATPTPE